MGGICDNVRRKVYPEVEINDDLAVGLGVGVAVSVTMVTVPTLVVMVGVDDAGSGFLVSSVYVEVVRWRNRRVREEEAVECFTWIAQHEDNEGESDIVVRDTHRLRSDGDHGIR